jgi:uncharacterized protein (DUF2141 family)
MKSGLLFIALLCWGFIYQANAQKVIMTIEGIRNNDGVISLGIFQDQQQFAQEKPAIDAETGRTLSLQFDKTGLQEGVTTVEFDLKPGNYAIAVLDDENNDGKMNYNWLGVPLEGFGFSNYVSRGLRKPVYSDFSFDVTEGENRVVVKMRYM